MKNFVELSQLETITINGGFEKRWSYYVMFGIGVAVGTAAALLEDAYDAMNDVTEEVTGG